MVRKFIGYFQRSEFLRHTLTLMTGSSIAVLIPIAASPILTRLYTPAEFGIFAIFGVLLAFITSFASLRFDVAIMLPESEDDAKHLVYLSSALTTLVAIIFMILLSICRENLTLILGKPELDKYLLYLPITLFFLGQYSIMNYYLGRKKEYKYLSQSKIFEAASGSSTHIGMGLYGFGVVGLIMGQIFGSIAGCLWLYKKSLRHLKENFFEFDFQRAIFLAKRYSNFPKYDIASTALGTLSVNLHIILFSLFFGDSIIGIITLAARLISKPLQILSASFSQVFYQKISTFVNFDELYHSYFNGVKKLSLISVVLILIALLLPNDLIEWVFGSNWSDVGTYLKILVLWYCVQFIGSSVSVIYNVLEMQKFVLWFQLIGTILTVITIVPSYYMNLSDTETLGLFVLGKTLMYLYLIFHPYFILKMRQHREEA